MEIAFYKTSEKLIDELRMAEMQFENARFSRLMESELQEYKRLSEQIKESTLEIILK